jgi:ribosomal protein S18 acetylase RimI-like enzyme
VAKNRHIAAVRSDSTGPGQAAAFTFDDATPADVDGLVELENVCFDSDRLSRRSFRKLIDSPTAACRVVTSAGRIMGYALLLFRSGTGLARLYSIAVHPDQRGAGIGALLLKDSETCAFERGRVILRLEVREDNAAAIRLYERLGYRRIGRYLNYYADKTDALRFEKRLRGADTPTTTVPYYEQTTDFTCGPCCVMMALAYFRPDYNLDPVEEIRIWREATTVFLMSGLGGCDPHGLAAVAARDGLAAEVHVNREGSLFLDSVRDKEKQRVMALAQEDFRRQAADYGIPTFFEPLGIEAMRAALASGALLIVLVSAYRMFGKKIPHWILVVGDDGRHFIIHDPWVEHVELESHADAANLPIPYDEFDRMARYGRDGLRAAVILRKR